jgi:hypothetical protein
MTPMVCCVPCITATLLDALNQKFGISATKEQVLRQLHPPQLFLAMQYHTGTRFQDLPGTAIAEELTCLCVGCVTSCALNRSFATRSLT